MSDGRKIMVQDGRDVIKADALDVHTLLGLKTNIVKKNATNPSPFWCN